MFNLPKKYWKQLSFYGKYLYIYDEIKNKIYPYKAMRKLKDVYWEIKNVPKTIKKIWFFIPTLWNYSWHDYSLILNLWSKSLEYNIRFYSDKNKVMLMERDRKLIFRKMIELKAIFNRLEADDYPELYEVKYSFKSNNDIPIIKNGKIWAYQMSRIHSEKEWKLVKANLKHKTKLRNKDLKNIGKILEKYLLTWWN